MAATCPSCQAKSASGDKNHETAHGLHTSLHLMTHVSPVLGLVAMLATGINALAATSTQTCACGHRF